ncbi:MULTISPECIES: hypothetical protein [unclassified Streptomyces]|nr:MULTISPECIES: hypothetical protein [unclassified Streptomyces]
MHRAYTWERLSTALVALADADNDRVWSTSGLPTVVRTPVRG